MDKLKQKLAQLIADAKSLLEEGKTEEAAAKRKEAENVRKAIDEYNALSGLGQGLQSDGMQITLPGTEGTSVPNVAGNGQNGQQNQNGGEGAAKTNSAAKAAYVMRFGEPNTAVKAILSDLHGSEDEAAVKYWEQKRAFNYYLRSDPQRPVPSWVTDAMSEVIMTPAAIKSALEQGMSDVKALKATMVEASDTLGGYLVPVDFQARVIERLRGLTVMRGRASTMNTSRDRIELPKATGGDSQHTSAVRVTWVDETPTAGTAETNLTFGLEAINVHTVMAETPLSRNLIEDSAFNLEMYLAEKFAESAAIDEDNRFLTGDGAGKPQGILPGSTNALSLTEENSGNASALTWDGLIGLTFAIDAQYRQNAAFIMEKATVEAIAKLKDGDGNYLWRYGRDNVSAQAMTLLGYPVLEQEAMPSIGADAYPIIFGDPRGYTIVDRVGMSVERYLDSQTARQNLVYYVMRRRLGGQVTETWRFAVQKVAA